MRRFRAAWVVHGPVGLVVIPARCTLRVATSMTNRTWNRRRSAVSTHAKSVAMTALAWERMNSDQDGSGAVAARVDAGGPQDLPHGRRGDPVAEAVRVRRGPAGSPTSGSLGPSGRSAVGARDRRRSTRRAWSVVGSSGGRRVVGASRSPLPGCTISNARPRRARSITEASSARIVRSVSLNCGRLIWRCSTRT